MLWDTAGQEEFDAITKAYYRGAQACVVAFSTTDRHSFEAVRKWKKKVCMIFFNICVHFGSNRPNNGIYLSPEKKQLHCQNT